MKSLKVKNILDKGVEGKMDEQRKQEIDTIQEALDEKRIREIQNLELRLEKDRLCAEMANVDAINSILNSTSHNEIGCPKQPKVEKHECEECKKKDEPKVEQPVCCPRMKMPKVFKNHKKLFLTGMWIIMIVLAIGISPQGAWFTTLQESWVNLFVDFFKVGLFAMAGFFTYKIIKDDKDEDE